MKKLIHPVLVAFFITGVSLPATSSEVKVFERDCAEEAADFLEEMLNDGIYTPTQAAAMAAYEYQTCVDSEEQSAD